MQDDLQRLQEENRILREENATLHALVAELLPLKEQVAQLSSQLNQVQSRLAKDSHNSHLPPSSDRFAPAPKSVRKKSGKKPGAQPGHEGTSLSLSQTPDLVVTHEVQSCAHCQADLSAESVLQAQRRQVLDVPPKRLIVWEHQAHAKYCPTCQQISTASFPEGVGAPVQYGPALGALAVYLVQQQLLPYARACETIQDLIGPSMTVGTLTALVERCAQHLQSIEEQIATALQQGEVMHQDETGLSVGSQRFWMHVGCTASLTHYAVHANRGRKALEAIGLLKGFTGVSVHDGTSDPRPNFGIVFRAPGLAERQPHGPAIHYWVLNPSCPGVMGRMDMEDMWWVIANGVPAEIGHANPHALIHGLVGTEIDVEILGTDPWTARMLLADRYRNGRVFLAGDAAHLNPSWGGHGFNTGIGDAVNIGWKLAAVLEGWGGDGLLASYEAERRAVAERTIREATLNMSVLAPDLGNPELDASGSVGEQARRAAAQAIQATKDREFHSLGLVLGYQYNDSPVIVDDGTPPLPEGQNYEPTAQPGARLPHLWLPDEASLYDRLGNGLSLLQLRDDAAVSPFIEAAAARRVPLTVIELHGQALEDIYGAPLLLVRPDQDVAWRGSPVDQATAGAVMDRVRGI